MWRAAVLAVAIFCGVGGCVVDVGQEELTIDQARLVEAPAGTAEATALVAARYGIASPPLIYWYAPDVKCFGGFWYGDESSCWNGLQGSNGIILTWADKPSASSLAHELAHWRWVDHDHADLAIWGLNPLNQSGMYEPGSQLGDATLALVAAGL